MLQDTMARLLELAKAAGFAQAEAYYNAADSFGVTVFEGEIDSYEVNSQAGLSLRGLMDGKLGYASSERLDGEALEGMAQAAARNARLIGSKEEQFLYGGGDACPELPGAYNPALEQVDARRKIDLCHALEEEAKAADSRVLRMSGCVVGSSRGETRMLNSLGLERQFSSNLIYAAVEPVVRDGENMQGGVAYAATRDFDQLNAAKLARQAVGEALSYIGAAPVPSGSYAVVLRYDAMASLLATFSGIFSAEAAQRGLSLLGGKEGQNLASPLVTLLDDPFCPHALSGAPFDGEGVPQRAKAVIEAGQFQTLLHNLKTAHKAGTASTGNASRPSYRATVGVAPSNLYLKPGAGDFAQLARTAGRGIAITQLMGMHAGANPVSGDFSLAAKGFQIEGGQLGRPVEQITVAGNFYQLLKDMVAVGGDLWFDLPGACSFGSPSVLVEHLSIAGA